MKNIKEFILESAKLSSKDTKLSLFPVYNAMNDRVGVAACRPMSVDETSIEYKAIEMKAKQQLSATIEDSWKDYMRSYDLEGNPHKYILFIDTSMDVKNPPAYWMEFSDEGCQRIEKL